ncbi:MAG: Protein translocase subunit SecA, partial [Parcubacteria group bacterium GW2011_GWC2_42_13]
MPLFKGILGGKGDVRFLKSCQKILAEVNGFEKEFEKLEISLFPEKTKEFKSRLQKNETLEDILPEAFALVREAAKRTLNQRHFDVQMLGGLALHQGKIIEMKTGEGKTLVATLPAYLNALSVPPSAHSGGGGGVHIVTVNDYLARRDAVWMGQIYHFLGLSVGCINHEVSYLYDPIHQEADEVRDVMGSFKVVYEFLKPCLRKDAYEADITYGTNNEFGFDYLRDNMVFRPEQMAQRPFYFAIVDEVDSILIDEARTPLIISAPDEESGELYKVFSRIVFSFKENEDYSIDEKDRAVSVTEPGIEKAEKALGLKDIYTEKGIKYVHHLEQALRAKALFHRDKHYVVKNNEVIIVDEFTGRLMPGRRWSEGLHQAIEAKEGVAIQKESRTLATITFQNYFRMYQKLAGMTGTALTSAEEFHKVYNLEVVPIPTNNPMIRKDLPDKVFQTEKGKFKAVAAKIKELHQTGQPVLVGTVSISKNEYLSALLKTEGIPHEVLNAKQHEREGEIIAQAGKKGKVTIATNMAGRGVDIILGGNPAERDEAHKVREVGGLFVLGTERHEARRIDNQLRGRGGRQGDSGASQFFVSLEDDLLRIFGSDRIKRLMATFKFPEDEPIEHGLISRALESAQSKIEGMNFDLRKHLLEYDDVMNKQRQTIYKKRREILFGQEDFIEKISLDVFEEDKREEFVKKEKEIGREEFFNILRNLWLQVIDLLWIEHLEMMEYLRASVRLRAYGQRDPLVEYKNEGVRLFRELETAIDEQFSHLVLQIQAHPKIEKPAMQEVHRPSQLYGSPTSVMAQNKGQGKVGRNDPCPCGSGKKYKRCHGA